MHAPSTPSNGGEGRVRQRALHRSQAPQLHRGPSAAASFVDATAAPSQVLLLPPWTEECAEPAKLPDIYVFIFAVHKSYQVRPLLPYSEVCAERAKVPDISSSFILHSPPVISGRCS